LKLIGMLDSPYVRRVAISLQLLDLRFEHQALSVFRNIDEFRLINPVIKVPTLVCDDGTVLMDSTLILEYAEVLARPRSLMPTASGELRHDLRVIGLALAACEKSVQIYYEHLLRPPEKLHQPWLTRITGQVLAAYAGLEAALAQRPYPLQQERLPQAAISAAVAWQFTQQTMPDVVVASDFPLLAAYSQTAELLPAFAAAPHGTATYQPAR
jgi:glutathione S-transferase